LVRPLDFEDWAGYEAKIELNQSIEGRKRFRGTIEGLADNEVRLEVDLDQIGKHIIGLPIEMVAEARLVLTDDLVRESLRRSKAGESKRSDGDDDAPPADRGVEEEY
jgi:ribosome maturation factor RimP